jgi:hypothetical protein
LLKKIDGKILYLATLPEIIGISGIRKEEKFSNL